MNPVPVWLAKLWNTWDVRLTVLGSLALQIILIFVGSKRKFIRRIWIDAIVWSAYLMADAVATITLGKLSDVTTDDENRTNYALMALWAPLLLLHLGGPDSITAYSVEDADLWLRHLLGLLFQLTVAVYIFLRCWTSSWLTILTIPMFVSGIIKCGERTWVLRIVKREKFDKIFEFSEAHREALSSWSDIKVLGLGYFCSRFLIPDLKNSIYSGNFTTLLATYLPSIFEDHESAFKIAEIGLSLMFDVIYTKAAIIYSTVGLILRSINFICLVIVLVGFSLVSKHGYTSTDICIAYTLLVGGIMLEIYAFLRMIFSDWWILLAMKSQKKYPVMMSILRFLGPQAIVHRKRWSNSIAQFNLLSFCLHKEKQNLLTRTLKLFKLDNEYLKFKCQSYVHDQLDYLKELIFNEVKIRLQDLNQEEGFKLRGELAIYKYAYLADYYWILNERLDSWVIIWHIATDICYYHEEDYNISPNDPKPREMEAAISLSNYVMYLLFNFPSQLIRTEISTKTKLADACENITSIIKRLPVKNRFRICAVMYGNQGLEDDRIVKAVRLATLMLSARFRGNRNYLWKMVSEVWVETLCYLAALSTRNIHDQQLPRGGELFSHAWLLLSISGMTDTVRGCEEMLRRIFMESLSLPFGAFRIF